VVVPFRAICNRRLAAEAVHLRPAGHAGFDTVAFTVAADLSVEELDELWSLRPWAHQTHVALDDVEQLGELVQRRSAHDLSDARAAVHTLDTTGRLTVGQLEFGVGGAGRAHRAELEAVEDLSITSHAGLAEHDRSG